MTKEQAIKLLSKDTSVDEVNKLTEQGLSMQEIIDTMQEAMDMGIEAIKNQTWISVKDRLPEEAEIGEGSFIVQEKDVCEPFSAYWDGDIWTDVNCEPIDDVLAWMPLPKPYKEGEVDD